MSTSDEYQGKRFTKKASPKERVQRDKRGYVLKSNIYNSKFGHGRRSPKSRSFKEDGQSVINKDSSSHKMKSKKKK
jgi:hypothetical protein